MTNTGYEDKTMSKIELEGLGHVYDLTEEPVEIVHYRMSAAGSSTLSDQLKPNQVELSAEVKIVWLIS